MREYYRLFRAQVLQRLILKSPRPFAAAGPTEVVGYLTMSAGVGESARLCADSLFRAGHPIGLADVSTQPESADAIGWRQPPQAGDRPANRIWHLNPPMLPRAILKRGPLNFTRAFNIGYWAWELEVLPQEWQNAFRYMNAIFVPSEFTRRAMQRYTDLPVLVVPHPVTEKTALSGMRQRFSIPDDAFMVSCIFSAGSSINRKNPDGVIAAFRRFAATRPNSFLLMKASGDPARDERLRALVDDAHRSPNIRILTDNLPSAVIQGIIRDSDAYLSLHRSEGFGLTVAEAILHGTPTVSTNWSGTVDFCDPLNTWNTRFRLIPVVDAHPEFAALNDALWADADIGHAAEQLQAIAADPDAARRKAAAARRYLENYLAERSYGAALSALAGFQRTSPKTALNQPGII